MIELTKIFSSILDKPDVPKFYRDLQSYYHKNNMAQEASAIGFLIENKFGKNYDKSSDSPDYGEKQQGNN
jgi:hypothetical protein